MFRCVPCNFEFKTEINLVKHRATLHAMTPDSISNAVDGAKTFADVVKVPETPEVASKIPVVTSSVSTARSVAQQSRMEMANKRSYNCHECNFNGINSKNLAKHVRETGHKKHDDLQENCYSCGKTFPNFETLMLHRKEVHGQAINKCRYKDQNLCKFGETCWYSHQDNAPLAAGDQVQNQDFQVGQGKLPPELKLMVTEMNHSINKMMETAVRIWQQSESRENCNRSQGQ